MCKKMISLMAVFLLLGSVSPAEDIEWTDLGADHLWSTPENWSLGRVPTLDDEVRIDVPAAASPNGPVIQDGIDAKAKGIFTEAAGEPTLTMTGGTLEVAQWIWWGDGADSFGIMDISGGTLTVTNEFELGWGGGAGTLTITGGSISAGEAVIPTGSGAFGKLYLYGGTYNVTAVGGLSVKDNGLIDITEGTLVLEGDDTAKVNDLIAAGLITAYGGSGQLVLDFDGTNPGKTTLTGIVPDLGPVKPSTEGLVAYYALDGDVTDSSGNSLDGTLVGDPAFVEGQVGMALELDGDDYVDCGSPPELMITDAISIACWVNPAQLGGEQGFAGLDAGYSFKAHGEGVRFTTPGILDHSSANLTLEAGAWQHVAATFQPGLDEGLVFYLNGNETERITSSAINVGSGPFRIGNNQWNEFLTGLIDEVMIYNRVLSEPEIRYLAGERATPVDPGTAGLLAYWPCDEGEGSIVGDASGNGNDGILNGDPQWVDGKVGGALKMDGGDYVEVPGAADINPESITLMTWVNFSTVDGADMQRQDYLSRGDDYAFSLHEWGYRDGTEAEGKINAIVTSAGGWTVLTGTTLVEPETWYHTTLTYDSATQMLKLYLDGEVEGDMDLPTGLEHRLGGSLTIGTYNGRDLLGKIDDIKIYDRALSAGEIRYLAGYRPGPVVHFKFDEGEGTIAVDSSGNGNDGTLQDGPTFVEGQFGLALEFEDNRVAITASDTLTADLFQGTFTLAAWINPKRAGDTWQQIFRSIRMDDTSNDTLFINNDGRLSWRGRVGGGWAGGMCETASDMVPADQWTHFAVTGDETNFRIYLNGALSQESAFQTTDGSNAFYYIAGDPTWIDESYSGSIDDVRIYDRALASDEISELVGKEADPLYTIPLTK